MQIHDQDLGLKFAGETDGLGEITGFADELQVRFASEKTADGLTDDFGIVGKQDFDWQRGLEGGCQERDNTPGNDPLTIPIGSMEGKHKIQVGRATFDGVKGGDARVVVVVSSMRRVASKTWRVVCGGGAENV